MSIDEVACRLMGTERQVPVARALALKIKHVLREQVGECLTCSIGIAPNVFLGKVGSDLQKPDGLVVITAENLPDILLELELQEIYGIGERMEQRLHRAGIFTVDELWRASPLRLRRVWGGINGVLFHQMLHGVDIRPPSSRFSKSIGHQHVLEPELRTSDGARNFAQHLLTKGAERLRRGDYYCSRLGVGAPLADFVQHVHDAMPDAERQKLLRFVPRLLGSRDMLADGERAAYLANEALRNWLPLALEAGGFLQLAGDFALPAASLKSYRGHLAEARKLTNEIPLLAEVVIAAVALVRWDCTAMSPNLAAEVAVAIMQMNDPAAREIRLYENAPFCRFEPIKLGRVPGIYDAILHSIDGALRLGCEGPGLDPWFVREAAERFRALRFVKSPKGDPRLPMAIVEPGLVSA